MESTMLTAATLVRGGLDRARSWDLMARDAVNAAEAV
jgi:hypothetical protein